MHAISQCARSGSTFNRVSVILFRLLLSGVGPRDIHHAPPISESWNNSLRTKSLELQPLQKISKTYSNLRWSYVGTLLHAPCYTSGRNRIWFVTILYYPHLFMNSSIAEIMYDLPCMCIRCKAFFVFSTLVLVWMRYQKGSAFVPFWHLSGFRFPHAIHSDYIYEYEIYRSKFVSILQENTSLKHTKIPKHNL